MKVQSEQLLGFLLECDRESSKQLVKKLLAAGTDPETILADILNPAMLQLGVSWGEQTVSLSQSFVAAKIAEDIFTLCRLENNQDERCHKGVVVIGNIEDDFHSLGRRIVLSFLSAAGWELHDLGNDVPAEQFVETAIELNASIIGVSAMMQTTALNIRKVRALLDEQGVANRIKLAVGGAVFNWRPELVEEVGADGSCANATDADKLFMRLAKSTE